MKKWEAAEMMALNITETAFVNENPFAMLGANGNGHGHGGNNGNGHHDHGNGHGYGHDKHGCPICGGNDSDVDAWS